MSNAIERTRMRIIGDVTLGFYASVMLGLNLEITEDIPTACTDGKTVKFNPKFFDNLSEDERVFLHLHELGHVVLGHTTRLGNREPRRFNAACDYAINQDLIDMGYKMPSGGLHDSKYKGMTAEEIYEKLADDQEYDDPDIEFGDSPEDKKHQEEVLVTASTRCKMQKKTGVHIPETTQRMLDELLNPSVPWNVIFQGMLTDHAEDDYSLEMPDQEYLPDLYVESLFSEGMGSIYLYEDVSGSVGQHEHEVAITEINALHEQLNPREMGVITFDTAIRDEVYYPKGVLCDIRDIKLHGGGGTSVGEIYEHIEKNAPEIAVVMTDGYYSERKLDAPNTHIIYLIYDNKKFTTANGRVIHIDTKDYVNGKK